MDVVCNTHKAIINKHVKTPFLTGFSAIPYGLQGPQIWLPQIFFLRGYLKDRVFKRHSENLEQLRQFILQEMTTFTPEILQAVYDNMVKRVRKCLDVNGGHVEPFV